MIYTLKQDLLIYNKGSYLIEKDNYFYMAEDTNFKIPKTVVLKCDNYFEKAKTKFNEGDKIWFLSFTGIIIADLFQYDKHFDLELFGNIFSSEEEAIKKQHTIKEILS